uniref:Uncharacterized protein n=1 Tax=Romanomermis culicivorax TaxID=13658 RepID=A0A915I396_ROMCU
LILDAYLRSSSALQSSQILRVSTQTSGVRDVAVPAPIPIKMASLPDDLATLNVEGDVGCNIMDILQFEMSYENGES